MYKKFQRAGNARHLLTPYKSLHTRLKNEAASKGLSCPLTYEQYVGIIKSNSKCVYCHSKLKWVKHGNKTTKLNLDRKNNDSGYNIRNVVASCYRCNMARANRYSHKDWYAMNELFRQRRSKK